MNAQLELVLSRLQGVKKTPKGWRALCPAHADNNPSLDILEGDEVPVILYCHAQCATKNVVAALGLNMSDLMPPRDAIQMPRIKPIKVTKSRGVRAGKRQKSRWVCAYEYRDEQDTLLFQVVRFDDKSFPQRRPDGKGGWIWNLNGVRLVIYRLKSILNAPPDEWIIIVEGEKDVDNLVKLGFVATCNPRGAGKWRGEYNDAFRNRQVCVIGDKDKVGRKHVKDVVQNVQVVARDLRTLELPGNGKDVSDWIEAGGTAEQLRQLIENAPVFDPVKYQNYVQCDTPEFAHHEAGRRQFGHPE